MNTHETTTEERMVTFEEIATTAQKLVSDESDIRYLRIVGPDDAIIGEALRASRVWDDGDPTDELLPGTCALDVERLDDWYGNQGGGYWGILVGVSGEHIVDGADLGEVILDACVITHIFG